MLGSSFKEVADLMELPEGAFDALKSQGQFDSECMAICFPCAFCALLGLHEMPLPWFHQVQSVLWPEKDSPHAAPMH